MRKSLIAVGVAVVALIALLLASGGWGHTARSRVAWAFLAMTEMQTALVDRCVAGTLTAGLHNISLGFPERYKSDPHVRHIGLQVESSKRARIIATLEDIRSDIRPFWMDPEIPSGAILEIEIRCHNRVAERTLGAGTTVPEKYLPSSLRRTRSNAP